MSGHQNRAHALLSASGASRWMNCTPSAKLEDSIKTDGVESEFAREGTFAHELAELKLLNWLDPKDQKISNQLREKRKQPLYNKDLNEHVDTYVGYVIERFNEAKAKDPKAVLLIEEKLDLGEYVPEGFGTVDAGIVSGNKLEEIDLKFGRGVKVDAEDNKQLRLYGLGFASKYELIYSFDEVTYTIVQPRLDHISSETVKLKDLVEWGKKEVIPTAKIAFEGEGELKVGSWCKFCKIKPTCRAMKDFAFKEMQKDFSDGVEERNEADPYFLSIEEIEEAFRASKIISDWVKSVGNHVLKQALSGVKFPNLKLVRGKANRTWKDEEEALKALRALENDLQESQITNTKIKGITELEKLLGKKQFAELDLTVKPLGSPTVVERSDKRPEYEPKQSLEEDFSSEIIEN